FLTKEPPPPNRNLHHENSKYMQASSSPSLPVVRTPAPTPSNMPKRRQSAHSITELPHKSSPTRLTPVTGSRPGNSPCLHKSSSCSCRGILCAACSSTSSSSAWYAAARLILWFRLWLLLYAPCTLYVRRWSEISSAMGLPLDAEEE